MSNYGFPPKRRRFPWLLLPFIPFTWILYGIGYLVLLAVLLSPSRTIVAAPHLSDEYGR